jgi:O-antigen/teichoic acid export membrane protein
MPDERSFKSKVINGFLWMGTGSFVGQALSWISTIIIIRLLLPSDYGLMAMASTFVALLATIGELGIGASIIQAEKITEREVRLIYGVVIGTSICGLILCYFSAPWIAAFYKEARLIPILRLMGFAFLLIALYAIPQSMILREIDFRTKTQVDIASQVGGAVLSLLLALGGFGVWSLVIGFMGGHVVKAVGYNIVRRGWLKPLFGYREVKKFIDYGVMVTGDRLLYSLYVQMDKIIVGRFLGNAVLGLFAVASNLSSIPAEKALPIVTQVMFTSYSRIQNDMDRIRRNILRTTRAIAYSGFPLFFGMAALAPEGIPLVLGPKWASAVVPFQLFCLIMPLKALGPVLPPAIFAMGKPKVNMLNMFINLVVMSVAFLIGVNFGIHGVCLAWAIAFPFVFIVNCVRCLNVLEMPLLEYLTELRFPLIASLLMVAFITALRVVLNMLSPFYSLAILTVLGVLFYFAVMVVFKKEELLKIKDQFLAMKS